MSSIRPWRDIDRRKSRQIMVGSVPVGGDAPISVQTMTNTPTSDAKATIDQIRLLEDHGFREYKVAVKASDVFLAVAAYQQLADQIDCPLHLGVTEAGGLIGGTVKSALGIGSLLWAGIGDTIRVSLSAEPEEEVRVGYEILKSLGIRSRGVRVVSCPSCARQGFDVIRTVEALEDRAQHGAVTKLLIILALGGALANGLATAQSQPPLLIDSQPSSGPTKQFNLF